MSNSDLTVYIVDDDGSVRASLSRLLRCAGFACETHAVGDQFLSALSSDARGCAVIDVHMPGMTGIELMRRLRATRPYLSTILMTAYDSPEARQEAAAANIPLLQKPFDEAALLGALAEALTTLQARGGPTN